jgi:hypothetical protein
MALRPNAVPPRTISASSRLRDDGAISPRISRLHPTQWQCCALFSSRLAVLDLVLPGFNFAEALKRVLALLLKPSLLGDNQIPPQPYLPLVQGDGVTPTGFDGFLVGLWFGEPVAFMRDRTLDEGNDMGQASTGQMVV